jgi:O-antigen ligase
MTAILAFSLISGATRFGYTEWAVVNRFLGWFVLLAYAGTGALIVRVGGKEALRVLLLTYIGATVAVTVIEIALTYVGALGVILPEQIIRLFGAEGFAQNHNFFAFQLLMAMVAALSITRGNLKTCVLTVLMAGLWFAGSRSGWIALVVVLLAGLCLKTTTIREIGISLVGVAILALIPAALPWVTVAFETAQHWLPAGARAFVRSLHITSSNVAPEFIPSGASTQERLLTLVGGWRMFWEHPIFGAGLGAFRNLLIPSTEGIPLLIHSTALWLMAELGLVGLVIFLTPSLFVLISEFRRADRDEASKLIILCLLAFAVMSGPADMLYQRTFWILLGAGLAMPYRYSK